MLVCSCLISDWLMFIKKRLKMPKERLRKEEIKEGRAEGNNEAGREGWKEKQVLSYCDGVCLFFSGCGVSSLPSFSSS